MTTWIDCREWLPEDAIDVLFIVYGKTEGMHIHVGFYICADDSWSIGYGNPEDNEDIKLITINKNKYTVKFWTLLPESPEYECQ